MGGNSTLGLQMGMSNPGWRVHMTLDPSDCFLFSIFPQNWVSPTHKSQHP